MNEINIRKRPIYIIVSYTCNFISRLFQGRQKYGGFLLNCAEIPQIALYWKSWLWVWVDFKMGSVLDHSRKNPNRKKRKNGKRALELLDLSIYPWKFLTKWSFTPGNSTKLCYIHWSFRERKPRTRAHGNST